MNEATPAAGVDVVDPAVSRCEYPGCDRRRVPQRPGAPAPKYCDRPEHNRHSAYEARIRAARQRGAEQRSAVEVVTEGPGEITRSLWSLRETADVLIAELRTTGDVNQGRFDAIVAALDDITDAERVEAELRAVRAEAEARVAVANADAERQRVETAAARVLAEESNAASISATEALGASTVQVETLTLRVTDAERVEAELRAEVGERAGHIVALQAEGEAAAKRLAEMAAAAEHLRVERDQFSQSVDRLVGEIHDARQAATTAEAERANAEGAAERDREARIRAERESAESHARAEAAETLSAAHQDSARRADEARHGAEVRADAAERVAADERQRATTMADLLRQAQEAEAASRRRADAAGAG
jgi:colicin import membrane protein